MKTKIKILLDVEIDHSKPLIGKDLDSVLKNCIHDTQWRSYGGGSFIGTSIVGKKQILSGSTV